MNKRVLIVATVQSHVAQFHKPLMKLLKERGWEIHVAARDNLAEKNGLQLEYPDRVFDVSFQRSPFSTKNLKAYRQLKKIVAENHYDVIHCNTPVGGILGRLVGRKYRKNGTRIYYTAHGFHFYKGAPKKNWIIYYPIEKWMARYTDKLITITEEDFQLASSKFHCPVFHVHGVGVNTAKYRPISCEEQKKQKDLLSLKGPVLLNVGELLPNKNQKTAILSLQQVIKDYPETHLLIAGNGSEKQVLQQLVQEQGMEKHVTFLGYTTSLQTYMQICDAEIACSYREGLPLNVMEAMLCGKPVVASHNRGHDELVKEGETGYLVSPDDVDGFAKAVCKILRNGPETYSAAALNNVKPFTDVNVQQELKQVYNVD